MTTPAPASAAATVSGRAAHDRTRSVRAVRAAASSAAATEAARSNPSEPSDRARQPAGSTTATATHPARATTRIAHAASVAARVVGRSSTPTGSSRRARGALLRPMAITAPSAASLRG
ncbi:MAG: hypothetical protein ACK5RL_07880 [Acidimicrobiales bacterium]